MLILPSALWAAVKASMSMGMAVVWRVEGEAEASFWMARDQEVRKWFIAVWLCTH